MADFIRWYGKLQAWAHASRVYPIEGDAPYSFHQRFLANALGCVAISLPLVMLASAFSEGQLRDSLSDYYHATWQGGIFVAMLCFVGTFLFAYRGQYQQESRFSTLAAIFAFGVAYFPTLGPGFTGSALPARVFGTLNVSSPSEFGCTKSPWEAATFKFSHDTALSGLASDIHWWCAAGLFLFLLYYSVVIFPALQDRQKENGTAGVNKRRRNAVYYATALVMFFSMVAIGTQNLWIWWDEYNGTFWCEAAALIAFGTAWLVKGRVFGTILRDRDEIEHARKSNSLAEEITSK